MNRYHIKGECGLELDNDGGLVFYNEHRNAIAAVQTELDRLAAEVERLSGKTQFCQGCEDKQRELDRLNGRRCDLCEHFDGTVCEMYGFPVRENHYCASWEPKGEPK